MDSARHTEYHTQLFSAEVQITRPHHPLQGKMLRLLKASPNSVVVDCADGTRMRIPRGWTDLDGPADNTGPQRYFSLNSLLDAMELVCRLGRRP